MPEHDPAQHDDENLRIDYLKRLGYETRDVEPKPLIRSGLGLYIFIIASSILTYVVYALMVPRQNVVPPPRSPANTPPPPVLQTNAKRDIRDLRAEENRILHSYGWVDRNAGVVRIPINRAIDILAQRGLPTRSASANSEAGAEPATLPLPSPSEGQSRVPQASRPGMRVGVRVGRR